MLAEFSSSSGKFSEEGVSKSAQSSNVVTSTDDIDCLSSDGRME
jgi:hypothetical protein